MSCSKCFPLSVDPLFYLAVYMGRVTVLSLLQSHDHETWRLAEKPLELEVISVFTFRILL